MKKADEMLVTPIEAAKILGVHKVTIRRWIHAGMIVAARIGARFRIRLSDVERMREPRNLAVEG